MRELREILGRYRRLRKDGLSAVVAQVVKVQGSAYRGPGARMLIPDEGPSCGFLSGGCLEGDVRERSQVVRDRGRPIILRYDMTSPDDLIWGLGMGCDGIVDVLVERMPRQGAVDALAFLDRSQVDSVDSVVATLYGPERFLGRRFLLDASGRQETDIPERQLIDSLLPAAREALEGEESRQLKVVLGGDEVAALIEYIRPPVHLLICGSGYDAVPLAETAGALGWKVTLVDHRASLATRERFPRVEDVRALHPEEARREMPLDRRAVAVVMSHNYDKDLEWLDWLLSIPLAYIGMLGPRARTERLLNDLEHRGRPVDRTLRGSIYGPVGLDIGASSAEEIAVAVLAEIRAVLSGRKGGFLRERPGKINDRHTTIQLSLESG